MTDILPVFLLFVGLAIAALKPWELLTPATSSPRTATLRPAAPTRSASKPRVGMTETEWVAVFGKPYNVAVYMSGQKNLRHKDLLTGRITNCVFINGRMTEFSYNKMHI